MAADIVEEKFPDLIAGKFYIFTFRIISENHYPQPVTVGVCRKNQLRFFLLHAAHFECFREGFFIFRIRRGTCEKISVRRTLAFDRNDIFFEHPHSHQPIRNILHSGSVERRIANYQLGKCLCGFSRLI